MLKERLRFYVDGSKDTMDDNIKKLERILKRIGITLKLENSEITDLAGTERQKGCLVFEYDESEVRRKLTRNAGSVRNISCDYTYEEVAKMIEESSQKEVAKKLGVGYATLQRKLYEVRDEGYSSFFKEPNSSL